MTEKMKNEKLKSAIPRRHPLHAAQRAQHAGRQGIQARHPAILLRCAFAKAISNKKW